MDYRDRPQDVLPFVMQFVLSTFSRNGLQVYLALSSDSSLCNHKSPSSPFATILLYTNRTF